MTPGERPRSDAASFATVRHLDRLEEKLRQWQRRSGSAIRLLQDQVRHLEEERNGTGENGRRQQLEDASADERDAELAELRHWVLWVVHTYELELTFPDCWEKHPGVVEDLRGLADWHRALVAQLADDPRATTAWHEAFARFQLRALPGVMNRCVSGHRPTSAAASQG